MAGQGGIPGGYPPGMQGRAGLPMNPELQKLIQSRMSQAQGLSQQAMQNVDPETQRMMQDRMAQVMSQVNQGLQRIPTTLGQYPTMPALPAGLIPRQPSQGMIDPAQLLGQGMSLQRRLMGAVPPNGQQLSPLLSMLYRRPGGV